VDVLNETFPKLVPKDKGDRAGGGLISLLLRYPDLSLAVADALNRNAANLNKAKLEPQGLENLRTLNRPGKKE
jgi:eukaryotic-like serine/threonine-protein kinase